MVAIERGEPIAQPVRSEWTPYETYDTAYSEAVERGDSHRLAHRAALRAVMRGAQAKQQGLPPWVRRVRVTLMGEALSEQEDGQPTYRGNEYGHGAGVSLDTAVRAALRSVRR